MVVFVNQEQLYPEACAKMHNMEDELLPIFRVERVQLQFSISSDFVAAQVANNVLVVALSTGRILRIDLDNPSDIDGSFHARAFHGL